jgi:hypothetical protein
MVRFEKKFNKKSAGILKYFEDFLLNFFSKMAVLCAAFDRKTIAQVLRHAPHASLIPVRRRLWTPEQSRLPRSQLAILGRE